MTIKSLQLLFPPQQEFLVFFSLDIRIISSNAIFIFSSSSLSAALSIDLPKKIMKRKKTTDVKLENFLFVLIVYANNHWLT